jgi:hypothetical protein
MNSPSGLRFAQVPDKKNAAAKFLGEPSQAVKDWPSLVRPMGVNFFSQV